MTTTLPLDRDSYQPGVCNIGPDEIRRRRQFGHLATAGTVGLLAALLLAGAPRWARLVVAVPAAGAASGYLQARERFCAGYGRLGAYNFGPAGRPTFVDDAAAKAADRRKAREISLGSALVGGAVALAALLLPA